MSVMHEWVMIGKVLYMSEDTDLDTVAHLKRQNKMKGQSEFKVKWIMIHASVYENDNKIWNRLIKGISKISIPSHAQQKN